jgi:UDP-N-acetylmuramyl pentapeptide phosphotransferase/UDP-N-acetylglucosamine-1-phosphate transferase
MTSFWVSLGTSLALTGLSVPLLRRAQFMDVPNQRSSHVLVTPRGGGVAVMLAVVVGVLGGQRAAAWPLVLLAVLLAVVGLMDDARTLSSRVRLGAQVLLGTALSLWVASYAGTAGLAAAVFGVVCLFGVVSYVNAFNFMDGINGISALNATLTGAWFAWLGWDQDLPVVALVGGCMAGAALGFLPWNAPRARVFLGDVGSYGIGAVVAGLAAVSWGAGAPALTVVAPLLVYLADTGWVILRRARAGAPLMEAHREHVYQRLLAQGWGHVASACVNAGAGVLICLLVVVLAPAHPAAVVVLAAAVLALYLSLPELDRRVRSGALRTSA